MVIRNILLLATVLILTSCAQTVLESSIPYYYNVSYSAGISVDTEDGIDFGTGPKYTTLRRFLNVTNNYEHPFLFQWTVNGGGEGAMFIEPSNQWVIQPGETQLFTFVLIIGGEELGRYNGTFNLYRSNRYHENRHELLYLPDVFRSQNMFDVVELVIECSEKHAVLSKDLGFNEYGYFRVVKRC